MTTTFSNLSRRQQKSFAFEAAVRLLAETKVLLYVYCILTVWYGIGTTLMQPKYITICVIVAYELVISM